MSDIYVFVGRPFFKSRIYTLAIIYHMCETELGPGVHKIKSGSFQRKCKEEGRNGRGDTRNGAGEEPGCGLHTTRMQRSVSVTEAVKGKHRISVKLDVVEVHFLDVRQWQDLKKTLPSLPRRPLEPGYCQLQQWRVGTVSGTMVRNLALAERNLKDGPR
jgi:hypothetical protein